MKFRILIILFLLFAVPFASAIEPEQPNVINPSSPLYFLDRALENLMLRLTIDTHQRALLRLQYIKERNEEMISEAKKNNFQALTMAKAEQKKDIEEIERETEQLQNEQGREIKQGLIRSRNRLQELLGTLPESSKTGINQAIESHEINIQKLEGKGFSLR